jgi:hypothetical protein
MRFERLALVFIFALLVSASVCAQQSTLPAQRDPTAIALLQKSVATMATNVPADTSATGSVTIVEGSTTESGTIRILTRGMDQTAEEITLSGGDRAVIYSKGDAKEVNGSKSTIPPMELIVTDECPDFPVPLLLSIVNNTDEAFQYVGQETFNGISVQHVLVWNTFASNSKIQKLAPFTKTDIWLDSNTSLPVKLAYARRAGEGAVPSIPVEVFFSNYKNVNGILYPFQVKKSYNGTPWETIIIASVAVNTGLTDTDFTVEQE